MQNSRYALILSCLTDSLENAYQLPFVISWQLNNKCQLVSKRNASWPLSHARTCYQVIQAWNIYHLAAGKNWNANWPVSYTGKIFCSLAAGMAKSSWLVKKIIWLMGLVKYAYRIFTDKIYCSRLSKPCVKNVWEEYKQY